MTEKSVTFDSFFKMTNSLSCQVNLTDFFTSDFIFPDVRVRWIYSILVIFFYWLVFLLFFFMADACWLGSLFCIDFNGYLLVLRFFVLLETRLVTQDEYQSNKTKETMTQHQRNRKKTGRVLF